MKDELVVFSKPKSNISEDIRTIRTNLQFSCSDGAKLILVTSSNQGEGKSFISSNLAIAYAQTGERTLLVDSDLRLGRAHKVFKVSNQKGFSNLILEQDIKNYGEYIKKTEIPDLYVVPRGTVPPNPSELLNSSNTLKILEFFKRNFDHIIFDGVPINGLSDSLIMAKLVDRVIIVSCANYTKIDELENTQKALEKIDAHVAGVVLNKASETKRGRYSNYYE